MSLFHETRGHFQSIRDVRNVSLLVHKISSYMKLCYRIKSATNATEGACCSRVPSSLVQIRLKAFVCFRCPFSSFIPYRPRASNKKFHHNHVTNETGLVIQVKLRSK